MKSEALKPTIVRIRNESDEINRIWRSYILYRWKNYFKPDRTVLYLLAVIIFFTVLIFIINLPLIAAFMSIISGVMLCLGYVRIKI